MRVVHVFDKFINSGVHSAAASLHRAIGVVRPNWEQSAVVFSPDGNAGKVCPPWFFLQGVKAGHVAMREALACRGDKVAILHRAMRTPVSRIVQHISSFKCPAVVISHTLSPSVSANSFGICASIIAVSERMRSVLAASNPKSKIDVIRNFSDDVPARWSEHNRDKIVFGRVNSFNKIKHSNKFVSWFKSANFGAPAILRYVGSGSLMDEAINAYSSAYGHNTIDFLGWIEGRDNVLDEMRSWDAMLYHINEPEGTSMAVIDGMALGMPILTSDLPGNNEMLTHGRSAMLFGNLDDVTGMVRELQMPGRAGSLGSAARLAWESSHSLLAGGKRYCKIIESAASTGLGVHSVRKRMIRSSAGTPRPPVDSTDSLKRCESFLASNRAYINAGLDVGNANHICLLVTCKNKSRMLSECLVSISRQVYNNISISFVDDASSDQSRDVWLRHRSCLEKRGIECRHEFVDRAVGYAHALQLALSISPPDALVAILDADDALPSKACSALSHLYLSRPGAGFIWTQFVICTERLLPKREGFSSAPVSGKSLLDSENSINKKHCYSHWRSFRRFVGDHTVFDTDSSSAIDKFMGYRLEECTVGYFSNIPLYLYRSPGVGSMTASGTQSKNWEAIRMQAEKRRQIGDNKPKGFI